MTNVRGMRRTVEICSGVGGLSLGLESAGFTPVALVDRSPAACETIRRNRPGWQMLQMDVEEFVPEEDSPCNDVDLLVAGLPRVPTMASAGPKSYRSRSGCTTFHLSWFSGVSAAKRSTRNCR